MNFEINIIYLSETHQRENTTAEDQRREQKNEKIGMKVLHTKSVIPFYY